MQNEQQVLNVIYIAGYGRSGSTLLERILASHPELAGLGEIAYLADSELTEHYWEAAEGTPLWDAVSGSLRWSAEEVARREQLQIRHESRRHGWRYWPFRKPSAEWCEHTMQVLSHIRQALPEQTRWLVDSSKTARDRFFRPFQLARLPGVRVKMIHLVRDPRGSVQSVRRGSNAAMERGRPAGYRLAVLRAAWGWTMANLAGLLFRATHGSSACVRVRYEELASDPEMCLRRLGAFLQTDFDETIRRVREQRPVPAGEQFAGNRMRLESVITLRTDDRWRTEMSRPLQFLVSLLCFPVALFAMRRQASVAPDSPELQSAA